MLALQNSDNALAYVTWHDLDGEKDKGVASGGNHTFIFYRTQYRKHEIFRLNSCNTAHVILMLYSLCQRCKVHDMFEHNIILI